MKKLTFLLILFILCLTACTKEQSDTVISTATNSLSTSTPTPEPTIVMSDIATHSPSDTPAPSSGPGNGSFEDPFLPILLEGKEVIVKVYDLPKVQVEMKDRSIWVKLSQDLYFYTPYTINNITDFMVVEGNNSVGFTGIWRNQPGASFEYAHVYQVYTPTTDDLRINQYWEVYVDKLKELGLKKNQNYYPDKHESPYQKCQIMKGYSNIVETWSEIENQYFFSLCP